MKLSGLLESRETLLEYVFVKPHVRIPMNWSNFSTYFLPLLVSYYALAVLVQLPRTYLFRLALLPITLWLAFRAGVNLDLSWADPQRSFLNQGLVLGMYTIAMRATAWTFCKEPYRRSITKYHQKQTASSSQNDSSNPGYDSISFQRALQNAWDLMVNLRGIGWSWSQGLHIAEETRPTDSRLAFLGVSFVRLVIYVLAFDAVSASVRSFSLETFGSAKGGTIFDPSLPPIHRYLIACAVTFLAGWTAYLVIELFYVLTAIQFVLLFGQHPQQWPPLFDSPWLSTSLTDFWGKRWHQLFRNCFVSVGSQPFSYLAGRVGGVMGAFLMSSILHDLGMRAMDRGQDSLYIFAFFMMNGVGLILERIWLKTTGKRVCGIFGSMWAIVWLTAWGTLMIDAWGKRGLIGSQFFPEGYRPTLLLVDFAARFV
ncbi:hypothetical protein SERLA73DRAFT_108219 [Serpula lacrymans var. lacrymans S7.3]|uniref:Wax synthase domain-containing protein n=2 Tax=Serpula lacrymans var. lacrymans TaxID=341189 RepID=F8PYK9_SERL3|nr:uncharacterized protein SERLADRAFT_356147 [Serpula lacrymans var. lacrymans S7.9]EGN98972.1 hypothetical protein SERLA73DRAFT_108219 [Serpula lacrymans var. lacrymans S7.3]EGO24561.1 hypothetical protein SERLADRAFT_356147 [Serpula lacrymans var. lacrymans S7.9]